MVQLYLRHAKECEELAAMARMKANQKALLAAAATWRVMAAEELQGDPLGHEAKLH
jgi:hypothetical protein